MLQGSVAIVSATFPAHERGKALGTMGGVSAIAGALGPTIGGALTSAVSWRLVLLVNVPLAAACVVATLSAVPKDRAGHAGVHVDLAGSALLCLASTLGYGVVFFAVSAFSVVGALLAARLVGKPRDPAEEPRPELSA
jgi:MFS family permease